MSGDIGGIGTVASESLREVEQQSRSSTPHAMRMPEMIQKMTAPRALTSALGSTVPMKRAGLSLAVALMLLGRSADAQAGCDSEEELLANLRFLRTSCAH